MSYFFGGLELASKAHFHIPWRQLPDKTQIGRGADLNLRPLALSRDPACQRD